MENASKALIMAGSILIALMIIGAFMLMFNNLSGYQNSGKQTVRESQVVEFNNKYETYNRKNVRGSDLYSLFNQVIDYNRRKTDLGNGNTDEGEALRYMPMTITANIEGNGAVGNRSDFSYSGVNQLITQSSYVQSDTTNAFQPIINGVKSVEASLGGQVSAQKLAMAIGEIYTIEPPLNPNIMDVGKKTDMILKYNSASGENLKYDDTNINTSIINISNKYTDICKYYEYVQFKRAKFDCVNTEYDQGTGRIVRMTFNFTGKFE